MPDQTPLTDAELDAIRDRSAALATSIGGETRQQGRLADDVPVLLAEVDRLRAENAELLTDRTLARRIASQAIDDLERVNGVASDWQETAAQHYLRLVQYRDERDALAAKLDAVRKIKPQRRNSAMVTSEQLATMRGWNDAVDAIREALEPCECGMTDPSTWETYGGATEPGSMYEWNPDCPAHGQEAAPESPRPPAVVHAPGSTASERPEIRTGVSEALSDGQAYEDEGTATEWVSMPVDGADGWTIALHPDGVGVYDSTDHPALTGPMIPLGAVLAFIADTTTEETTNA